MHTPALHTKVQQRLMRELLRRSPPAVLAFIIGAAAFTYFSFEKEFLYSAHLLALSLIIILANFGRLVYGNTLVTKPEICAKKFWAVRGLILLNAICWGALFSVILLGFPLTSTAAMLALVSSMAIVSASTASLASDKISQLSVLIFVGFLPTAVFFNIGRSQADSFFFNYTTIGLAAWNVFFWGYSNRYAKTLYSLFDYEERLVQKTNFQQSLIDTLPGFVLILEKTGKINSANQNRVFTNVLPESFIGDLSAPLAQIFNLYTESTAEQKPLSSEIVLPTPHNEEHFLVNLSRLPSPEGLFIMTGTSAQQLKEAQAQALKERERFESAARLASLGEMAESVAHEINNPMTLIVYNTQKALSLLDAPEIDLARLKNYLARTAHGSDRVVRIVSGLSVFADSKNKAQKQRHCLSQIVENATGLISERIRASEIFLTTEVPARCYVYCNAALMTQVFVHLLNNAIDALKESSVKNLEVYCEKVSGYIVAHVIDSGPGISQDLQAKIFEPFFSTKALGEGSGIGLSIVKSALKESNGELQLHSVPGRTEFCISLPALE